MSNALRKDLRNKHANAPASGKQLIKKNNSNRAAGCRDADTCRETASRVSLNRHSTRAWTRGPAPGRRSTRAEPRNDRRRQFPGSMSCVERSGRAWREREGSLKAALIARMTAFAVARPALSMPVHVAWRMRGSSSARMSPSATSAPSRATPTSIPSPAAQTAAPSMWPTTKRRNARDPRSTAVRQTPARFARR